MVNEEFRIIWLIMLIPFGPLFAFGLWMLFKWFSWDDHFKKKFKVAYYDKESGEIIGWHYERAWTKEKAINSLIDKMDWDAKDVFLFDIVPNETMFIDKNGVKIGESLIIERIPGDV